MNSRLNVSLRERRGLVYNVEANLTSYTDTGVFCIYFGTDSEDADRCIVVTDGMPCGNCERHCPTESIRMVPLDPGADSPLKIPVVNVETCIGCGACEHLCPARPYAAIYVQGHEVHRTI